MSEQTISMGPGTHAIPVSLFRGNRLRVCNALQAFSKPEAIDEKTYVLLQGGDSINWYNTDVEYVFKQVNSQLIFPFIGFLDPIIDVLYRPRTKRHKMYFWTYWAGFLISSRKKSKFSTKKTRKNKNQEERGIPI